MSGQFFGDLEEFSNNGEYRFTASSPDNQSPNRVAFQSNFVYTLWRGNELLWQRQQDEGEESPINLLVSDQGWCVAFTRDLYSDHILTFSKRGELYCLVTVSHEYQETWTGDLVVAKRGSMTSAGLYWKQGSFPHFWEQQGQSYFSISTSWLQDITIRLEDGRFLEELEESLDEILGRAQGEALGSYLHQARRLNHKWRQLVNLEGAILLSLRTDFTDRLELVRALTRLPDRRSWSTHCHTLEGSWYVCTNSLAPLLEAATRFLKISPHKPLVCYLFRNSEDQLLDLPTNGQPSIGSIGASAIEVLNAHGSPHFVKSYSEKGETTYLWGEHWEYYLGSGEKVKTLRLTWEPGSNGQKLRSKEIIEVDLMERLCDLCAPRFKA